MLQQVAKRYTPKQILDAWLANVKEITLELERVLEERKHEDAETQTYYLLKTLQKHNQKLKFS